jgi:hypothetical protein
MSKHQHLPHEHEEPDPWHRHTPDEGLPQEEHGRANPAVLGVSLLATVVFLVGVVLVIFIYFETFTTTLRAERTESTALSKQQLEYKRTARETLNDYNVLPPTVAPQGVITVPIDQAKEKIIARYAGQK